MIRERGSSVAAAEHNPLDPQCEKAQVDVWDTDACCPVCGERLAREQAASAINLRELGS